MPTIWENVFKVAHVLLGMSHRSEYIIRNEKHVDDIFFQIGSILNSKVEFIGIINQQGRIERTFSDNDIGLSEEKKEMFCMGLRLQYSMQKDFEEDLGPVSYNITLRNGKKFVTFPFLSHTFLLIMTKNTNHHRVINKIKKMATNSMNVEHELLVIEGRSS